MFRELRPSWVSTSELRPVTEFLFVLVVGLFIYLLGRASVPAPMQFVAIAFPILFNYLTNFF